MEIAKFYAKTDLLQEFIPLFPITFFVDTTKHSYWRVFYLVKVMRIFKGIQAFKIVNLMQIVTKYFGERSAKMVADNP